MIQVIRCAAVLMVCLVGTVQAATSAQLSTSQVKGLAWLFQHQNGDGGWSTGAGIEVQSTSAVLDAFSNAGIRRGTAFNAGLAKLANANPSSIDSLARQITTLQRIGADVSVAATQIQNAANGGKAWGSLAGYSANPLDTALALSALLSAVPSYASTATSICNGIAPFQGASGGWSYGNAVPSQANAAIVPTAYAVLMLQKLKAQGVTSYGCSTSLVLATAINNGVTFLASKQNADKGFSDNGPSGALETALAYLAIKAANPSHTALSSAQDYLVATQQSNGSWAADPFQTALVLQTFPQSVLTDTAQDGIPDAVKLAIWNSGNFTLAAEIGLLPGNGQSIAGLTAPIVAASATINQPYSLTLTGSGGTTPYAFGVVSGTLPTGLTLAANGSISGTPTLLGPFPFIYQVKDATGATFSVDAEILVSSPPVLASGATAAKPATLATSRPGWWIPILMLLETD